MRVDTTEAEVDVGGSDFETLSLIAVLQIELEEPET